MLTRYGQKEQILLADAAIEILQRSFRIETKCDFVGEHAEFRADRIRHLASDQRNGTGKWQPDTNTANDDVDSVRQLLAESKDTFAAHYETNRDK